MDVSFLLFHILSVPITYFPLINWGPSIQLSLLCDNATTPWITLSFTQQYYCLITLLPDSTPVSFCISLFLKNALFSFYLKTQAELASYQALSKIDSIGKSLKFLSTIFLH